MVTMRDQVGGAARQTLREERQSAERVLLVVPVTQITGIAYGSAQTLLTANAREFVQLGVIAVCNTHGSTAYEFSLHIVPSGGSADATNLIENANSVAAKSTEYISRSSGLILDGGSTLQVWASTTAVLNISLWAHRMVSGEGFG